MNQSFPTQAIDKIERKLSFQILVEKPVLRNDYCAFTQPTSIALNLVAD